MADLVTSTISGEKIPIEAFRRGFSVGGGPYIPTVLKPGQSGTFSSSYAIDTLTFLKSRNKELFGEVLAWPAGTKEKPKEYYSNPIPIFPNLITVPWTDLGEQKYFTVTSDSNNISINPHKLDRGVWLSGSVEVPVSIKNTSGRPLIALECTNLSGAPIDRKTPPSYWMAVKATKPILQPGEVISSVCETDLDALESHKPGDKVVVSVEGRVLNTNQVFECHSAPFELPPLPHDKPPKGAVQIPGQ